MAGESEDQFAGKLLHKRRNRSNQINNKSYYLASAWPKMQEETPNMVSS